MVIVVSTTTFPYSKARNVAELFAEVAKKLPVEKDMEKPILTMAIRVTKDGLKSISITEVKKEKYDEFMKHLSKVQMEYFKIEGIKFEVEYYLSGVDAMALVGMKMPE